MFHPGAPPSGLISSLELAPMLKGKLIASGYHYTRDLTDVGPAQLAREIDITPREALQALRVVRQYQVGSGAEPPSGISTITSGVTGGMTTGGSGSGGISGTTALELLRREGEGRRGITSCNEQLDEMLGGGVPLGQLTEFCGVPGIGKTQLSMQLAVDVSIPAALGGLEGRCVYIDSEGSFTIERVVEMASALAGHLSEAAAEKGLPAVDMEYILGRIIYYRVHDYVEQLALVNTLPSLFAAHADLRLVVVDSVTFHFRHGFDADFALRTRVLNGSAMKLQALASKHGAAVVLVNQVTTKFSKEADASPFGSSSSSSFSIVPALGDSWGHMCTNRIILFWKNSERHAYLYKSPSRKSTVCSYKVVPEGIRGIES